MENASKADDKAVAAANVATVRLIRKTPSSSDSKDDEEEDNSPTVARIRITNSLSQDSSDVDSRGSKNSANRMSRIFLLSNRSTQSSSSQEEYEPETKRLPGGTLLGVNAGHQVAARSMESLQRGSRNFLSADERYGEDSRSLESLTTHVTKSTSNNTVGLTLGTTTKSHHHYRSFLSCSSASSSSSYTSKRRIGTAAESRSSENLMKREESLNAEVRRGLYASTGLERKGPRLHLSLPQDDDPTLSGPPSVFSLTSPGGSDRKIHILSPHSPLPVGDMSHTYSVQSLKSRRNKALVLPRLVLPRSESEVFLQ